MSLLGKLKARWTWRDRIHSKLNVAAANADTAVQQYNVLSRNLRLTQGDVGDLASRVAALEAAGKK